MVAPSLVLGPTRSVPSCGSQSGHAIDVETSARIANESFASVPLRVPRVRVGGQVVAELPRLLWVAEVDHHEAGRVPRSDESVSFDPGDHLEVVGRTGAPDR